MEHNIVGGGVIITQSNGITFPFIISGSQIAQLIAIGGDATVQAFMLCLFRSQVANDVVGVRLHLEGDYRGHAEFSVRRRSNPAQIDTWFREFDGTKFLPHGPPSIAAMDRVVAARQQSGEEDALVKAFPALRHA